MCVCACSVCWLLFFSLALLSPSSARVCSRPLAFALISRDSATDPLSSGYEYNWEDPPIDLLTGSRRWKAFLDGVQTQAAALTPLPVSVSASGSAPLSASIFAAGSEMKSDGKSAEMSPGSVSPLSGSEPTESSDKALRKLTTESTQTLLRMLADAHAQAQTWANLNAKLFCLY